MATMTSSEARAEFREILDRVGKGEEVTITRHGQPVAVVVRPDALRSRRAQQAVTTAEAISAGLAAARGAPLSGAKVISAERADEMVGEIRRSRRARS